MYWLWIFFGFLSLIVLIFFSIDVFNYLVFESKKEKHVWIRKWCWKWVQKKVLKTNHHKEVIKVLAPELVKKLDVFITSDAAQAMYELKGYKMLSDFMVLMIDSYYSTQN